MPRFLYVVARDRRDLYERLREEFLLEDDVEVIFDRREGERRLEVSGHPVDLRRMDRRLQRDLDRELRANGAFITASGDLVLVVVR